MPSRKMGNGSLIELLVKVCLRAVMGLIRILRVIRANII